MKKQLLLLITIFTIFSFNTISAQVGINISEPKATLDVVGSPADISVLDGIIPPRVTGDQLQSKNYTQDQNGALIYVTEPATTPAGQTINVREEGLYSFNVNKNAWVAMNSHINVGERVSVYRTMAGSLGTGAKLPDDEMIELEGIIRVGLEKRTDRYYKPYIENITSSPIKVTFASGFEGRSDEVGYKVNYEIAPNTILGIDPTNQAYWGNNETEILTGDVILPNGTMYEIQWMAYQDNGANSLKHIYMTAIKKYE